MGIPHAVHYERWRPAEARGKEVWVRYKDGEDAARTIILATGAITIGPQLNRVCDSLERYKGKVLAIETPAQGRSERLGKRRTISDYAAEIRDISIPLIGKGGLANSILVGHCLGADAVHALAREEQVAGTVLLNPIPGNSLSALLRAVYRFQRKSAESLFRLLVGASGPDSEHHLKDAFGPQAYNSSPLRYVRSVIDVFRVWGSRGFGPQAGGSPAILVTGQYDVQVSAASLQQISSAIGNAQAAVIMDSGHMTVLARPEKVADFAAGLAYGKMPDGGGNA